ncbi:hypothetical protein HK151_00450, partial [Streptococcus agalactiae]|nr:hypothetical protein [Streptococcus agalactiae]
TISNIQGEKVYFSVIPEDDRSSTTKSVLKTLESSLSNTDNFTIVIDSKVKNPTVNDSAKFYQIALSDGGKTIKIYELRRNPRDYGYYEFSGESD